MVQLLLISTVLLGFIPPALQPRTVARLPVSQLSMFEGRQREPKEPPVDGETPETPQDSEAPAPPRDPPPSTAAKNMKLISDGIFVLFTIAIQTLGAASVLGVLPVNSDSASARQPTPDPNHHINKSAYPAPAGIILNLSGYGYRVSPERGIEIGTLDEVRSGFAERRFEKNFLDRK